MTHPTRQYKPGLGLAIGNPPVLQRKCACGATATHGAVCEQCQGAPRTGHAARTEAEGPTAVQAAPSSVARTLAAGGKPLESAVRSDMEQRFGHDFFGVRVHDDALAASSARDIGAQAYAAERHVVFASGKYAPGTHAGRRLIAHELAHVVQQERGGPAMAVEERAEHAAHEATAGRPVDRRALGGAPAGLHAQPEEKAAAPAPPAEKPEGKTAAKDEAGGHAHSFTKVLDRFPLDKDTLSPAHLTAIEELAFSISLHTGMLAQGKARIEIVGHADTAGAESDNQKLGQDRADRVKEALARHLSGAKAPSVEWTVRSAGESAPAVPTGDNKREPRNRRVVVNVTIVAVPVPKKKEPIKLFPEGPLTDKPTGPVRPEKDDVWKKMEENQRRLDELNRKIGKTPSKSAQDVLADAIGGALDPLVDALPVSDSLKKKAREGIRDGTRSGSEKTCEAAVDATGTSGPEAEALKAACKAALKHKPGGSGGGAP